MTQDNQRPYVKGETWNKSHFIGVLLQVACMVGLMVWFFSWLKNDVITQRAKEAVSIAECVATGKPEWQCKGIVNGCKINDIR